MTNPTPNYNTHIPTKIMTADKVETRIGTLEFFDGIPTKETAALVYDNLDFLRGIETFLNGVPAASLEGLRLGQMELGATECHQVVVFDDLMDSNPLWLTGNTDTVYCSVISYLNKSSVLTVRDSLQQLPTQTRFYAEVHYNDHPWREISYWYDIQILSNAKTFKLGETNYELYPIELLEFNNEPVSSFKWREVNNED